MKLSNVVIPTECARPGMKVRDLCWLCVQAGVPAVPFRDERGALTGYVGLFHLLSQGCIPEYMVELAPVLGDLAGSFTDVEAKVRQLMDTPVEPFVQTPLRSVTTDAPVLKALAIMEKFNSRFLFVVDGGEYRGVVTTLGIARRMLDMDATGEGAPAV